MKEPLEKCKWNSLSAAERWDITEKLLRAHPVLAPHIADSHRIAESCERYPRQLPSDIFDTTKEMSIYQLLQHLLDEYGELGIKTFFLPLGFTVRKKRLGSHSVYMLMYDNSDAFRNDTAWALDTRGLTFAIINTQIVPARHTFPRAPEWHLDTLERHVETLPSDDVWASEKADGMLLNLTVLPSSMRSLFEDTTDPLQQALLHAFADCTVILSTKNYFGVHPEILPLLFDVFLQESQTNFTGPITAWPALLSKNQRLKTLVELLQHQHPTGATLQFELLPQDRKAFGQYPHEECKIRYARSECLFLGRSDTQENIPYFTPHFACSDTIKNCMHGLKISEPLYCQLEKSQMSHFIDDTQQVVTSMTPESAMDALCETYAIKSTLSSRLPTEGWVIYTRHGSQYQPIKLKTPYYKELEKNSERARGMEAQLPESSQQNRTLTPTECEAYFPKVVYYALQAVGQNSTSPKMNCADASDEANKKFAAENTKTLLSKLNFLKPHIEEIVQNFFNLETRNKLALASIELKPCASALADYIIKLIKNRDTSQEQERAITALQTVPFLPKEKPASIAAAALPTDAVPQDAVVPIDDVVIVGDPNGQDLDVFVVVASIAGVLDGPLIPEEVIRQYLQKKYPDLKINFSKPLDLTFCIIQNGELAYALSYKHADRKKAYALLPMDLLMRTLTLRHTGLNPKIPLSASPKLPTSEQAIDFLGDYFIAHASSFLSAAVYEKLKPLRTIAYSLDAKFNYLALCAHYLNEAGSTQFFADPSQLPEDKRTATYNARKTMAMRMVQFLQIAAGKTPSFYKIKKPDDAFFQKTMATYFKGNRRRFIQAWLSRDTRPMDKKDEAAFKHILHKILEAMKKIHPDILYGLPSFEPFSLDIAQVPKQIVAPKQAPPSTPTLAGAPLEWITVPLQQPSQPLLTPQLERLLCQTDPSKAAAKKTGTAQKPKGTTKTSRAQKTADAAAATAAHALPIDATLSIALREWGQQQGLSPAISDAELFAQCAHFLRGTCDSRKDIKEKTQHIKNQVTVKTLELIAERAVPVTEGTAEYLALLSLHPKPTTTITSCVLANRIGGTEEQRRQLMRGLYWEAVVSNALKKGQLEIDGMSGWGFIKPGVLISDLLTLGSPSITPDGFVIHPVTGMIYPVEIKVLDTKAEVSAANRSKEELAQAQLAMANRFCGEYMRRGLQLFVHCGGPTIEIRYQWTPLAYKLHDASVQSSATLWADPGAAATATSPPNELAAMSQLNHTNG